jgi:uncharacterized iron-regulated membrane protein
VYRAYGERPPAPGNARAARGAPSTVNGLETIVAHASARMPEWKTVSIAMPVGGAARVVATVDAGSGGQPHKRATLAVDRATGRAAQWDAYSALSRGRRARTWLRFAHTGEVYGLAGQTLAGLVTAGGAVLVWTGLALALRRLASWRRRTRATLADAA